MLRGVLLLFCVLFSVAARAADTSVTCPSWTGIKLVDCAYREDGSLERLREIDAKELYRELDGSGVLLTTEIANELLLGKTVRVSGSRQISFFFPYAREITSANLFITRSEENHNKSAISVAELLKVQKTDVLGTVFLISISILCIFFAFAVRLVTSRINPLPVRRFGKVLLIALVIFLVHFNIVVYQVVGFSTESLYLMFCTVLSVVAWFLGRVVARSRRYALDPHGRIIERL